ncbi:tetratricopeptide repeat protein [Aquabacterium humicola]|uniref:tetratricopeptide repeat protein n=1 Tax=Aquabacterium humicola TaxID=3237377 RepID=UPI0025435190|nr:tetratricopeptide repeat protein [Rubrivivax pictus]
MAGRYGVAERALNEALSTTIVDAGLWQLRGMIHFARGEYAIAMTDFETAALCGFDGRAVNIAHRIQTLQALGRIGEANALEALWEHTKPLSLEACEWRDAANLRALPSDSDGGGADRPRTTGHAGQKAIMTHDIGSHLAAGRSALEARDHAAAERHFRAVVGAHPLHGEAWLGIGMARLLAGERAGALAALEVAVAQQDARASASITLGWACIASDDSPRAHEVFEAGLAWCAASLPLMSGLAAALAMQGMRQAARELVRAVRLQAPDSLGAELAQCVLRLAGGPTRTASRSLSTRLLAVGRACMRERRQRVASECFSLALMATRDLGRTQADLATLLAIHHLP